MNDLARSARWSYRLPAEFGHQDVTTEVERLVEGRLALGQSQQVVILNLDNRPRRRDVVAVACGSSAG